LTPTNRLPFIELYFAERFTLMSLQTEQQVPNNTLSLLARQESSRIVNTEKKVLIVAYKLLHATPVFLLDWLTNA
jgi:hypothetical protein